MLRSISIACVFVLAFGLLANSTEAQRRSRNTNYYGTPRHAGARVYSGAYQASRPNVVPTFSLPVYGGGRYYAPYGYGAYGYGGYYPVYPQPVIVYPPRVVRFGVGF